MFAMAEKPKRGVGSKILRERAMAVLRDTRAKIDPQFLSAMKEMFSGFAPESQKDDNKPIQNPPSFADTMKEQAGDGGKNAKPAPYPIQSFDNIETPKTLDASEPVDQQKIAKIVLEYMKNKQSGQRH